jgi:adenylate kinase family enzyme
MLVLVLGLPGSGKSTLSRRLEKRGWLYLHPGKHARAKGWVSTAHATRAELLAVKGLAESFIDAVKAAVEAGSVVVDGFPRSQEQAALLLQSGLSFTGVHLEFPAGSEKQLSVARQEKRVKEDGVTVPDGILEQQTELGLLHDRPAIEAILAASPSVVKVDALLSADEVEALVLAALEGKATTEAPAA